MCKLKERICCRALSLISVASFILFDLSSAYPAEQLFQNHALAVPSVFQARSYGAPVDGIEIKTTGYEKPGVRAEVEALVIDLDKVEIEQSVDPDVAVRDFIDRPISEADFKNLGRSVRELVESLPAERKPVLAFNGIHGGYWESSSAVIINGQLITKPDGARGIFQNKYTPLNGKYWVLSLDHGNRGIFEIEIRNGMLPENFSVKNGLLGPPLVLNGNSMVNSLQFGIKPNIEGHQINWARDQRMAFSAIGYDKSGRLVRVAIKGDSNDSTFEEPSIDEVPQVLEKLGVVSALLAGTSADVQTYNSFSNNKFVSARPRKGSFTGLIWSDRDRPIGSHICIYAKSLGDNTNRAQKERFRLFVASRDLLSPVLDIAKYLLGSTSQGIPSLPLESMESVIRHDFQGLPLIVDPSKVDIVNRIVRIRVSGELGDITIQVAAKNNPAADSMEGFEWDASDEFRIKIRKGHIPAANLDMPEENNGPVSMIVSAAGAMSDLDGYLKLYLLDENVFIESANDFAVLPITAGKHILEFITQNKIISLATLPSCLNKESKNSRAAVHHLILAIRNDDLNKFVQILSDSNSPFSAEVFDKASAINLPEGIKTVVWKDEIARNLSNKSEVTVSVHQPGYHKDIRFFQNKLRQSDIHVFADNLQFVRQQWHNRQRFGGENNWLTVPLVSGSQRDLLRDKEVSYGPKDNRWREEHWKKLKAMYSSEPYFADIEPFFASLYGRNWSRLISLNEAVIRFMAKKMGLPVLFIRGSYVNDSGLTKAGYIADLVERSAGDLRSRGVKNITYLSGKGAYWLEDASEENTEALIMEKDRILGKGIGIAFDGFDLQGISEEDAVNPNMPAFEFLAKYGEGSVAKLAERRRMGFARKNLSTLVNFLSQSNEKDNNAEWIVLPVSNDVKATKKCAEVYNSSKNISPRVLLVENWPASDVSHKDKIAEAREALVFRQALEAEGVRQGDIVVLHDLRSIEGAISGPGRIILIQSPLKLRRSAAILKGVLKDVKFGAMPAYGLNVDDICKNAILFKSVAEECIRELRWMQDRFPVDENRRPLHFLPDMVHDAYGEIFRLTHKTTEELFREMRGYSSREKMLANRGFSNVGMFPDGEGSYRIDNRGIAGVWKCTIETKEYPANRYMLRTADAVFRAMDEIVKNNEMISLRFIDDLNHIKGDIAINDDHSAAILFSEHAVAVTPDFILRTRDEQEAVFRKLIGSRAKDIPGHLFRGESPEVKDRAKPDILVTQIAMVTELRSKDYQHYKCSQKTEGIAVSLREKGYDASYLPIEEDISHKNFLDHYARHKQDIVVISIYQIHRRDLSILHSLYKEIKRINPDAFIVMEGASTDMAKQFLAICPEIDMFVRVESDEIIPKLAAVKEKGRPLSMEQIMSISADVDGGIFIRSGSCAVMSKLDTSNVAHNVRLLAPTRHMFDIWYTERGCPRECIFCRRDQGGVQRYVPAEKRIDWLLDRLLLEIDQSSPMTRDELKGILKAQAGTDKILTNDARVTLAGDTFIGHEKVRILVVSENALFNRNNIVEFARQVSELGLNKYFIFKIADTDLGTVMRSDDPDTVFMEKLRGLGVDFIGFGTENPSNKFLRWWHKNQSSDRPGGYTTDHIIRTNKALIEAGFNPTGIRHNLILSFPEARDVDVRNAALLEFASPQYNSMPFYFGNGWGNNRFDRTFDVAASFLSSIDNAQYAWTFSLEPQEQIGSVDLAEYFYVARGTPEYMVRREFRFLRYIDERLPSWIARYAHPNFTSFYRYAQKRFLAKYFTDDDIKTAIAMWRDPSESEEVRALGDTLEYYCTIFPKKKALESLFLIKAHMVSLEMLSFVEYKKKIDENKALPLNLENCGVGDLFAAGDRLMEPGSFRPEEAIDNFRKAVVTARVTMQISPHCSGGDMLSVARICQDGEASPEAKSNRIRAFIGEENVLKDIFGELAIDSQRQRDISDEGYLNRIAYPDSQAFENLRHLYVNEDDEYLFDMIVHKMNEKKIEFPDAVKELSCERMGMSEREYRLYIKAAKEYMKHRVYYCEGGLISQLRSKDPTRRSSAIESILNEMEKEDDPLIIKNIAILLRDLSRGEGLLQVGAYIVSPLVVSKLNSSLCETESRGMFSYGERLAVLSYSLHNNQRLRLFKRCLENSLSGACLNRSEERIFAGNDWTAFRIENNRILLNGTRQREDAAIKAYTQNMRFGDNKELFSIYVGKLAEVLDKHRLQIIAEIKEFCDGVKDRPYLRVMFLNEEEFLYALPILKLTRDNPDLVPLFMARGAEPFYNAWWMMVRNMGESKRLDNSLYVKVGKRLHAGETEGTLVTKAINTFLDNEESGQIVSRDAWDKIIQTAAGLGITDDLDRHLGAVWGIKDGIMGLREKRITRREAVRLLGGFGVDSRFVSYFRMARGTYFPDLMRREEFAESKDGFPVERFKNDVRTHNAKLKYPLPTDALDQIMDGLDIIGGRDGLLLPMQRNTINNYLMMFGDTPVGSSLRGTIQHAVRPLLNILLEDTTFARMLRNGGRERPRVLFMDEATSSATSLYLCELVVRAFNPAVDYSTSNICQRTADTQRVLQSYGVVDHVAKNGLWPLEDINELFHGVYLDMKGRGRKQLSYKTLIKRLWAKQMRLTPRIDRAACATELEKMDSLLDEFIEEHEELFSFVDKVPTIRHDPQIIKRAMLKYMMERPDSFRTALTQDSYFMCVGIGEVDYIGGYILRDGVRNIQKIFKDSLPISNELKELYEKFKYADQATEMERHIDRQKRIIQDYVMISNEFVEGEMANLVKRYLSGSMDFSELEHGFYQLYRASETNSYFARTVYKNEDGDTLYSITRDDHSRNSLNFFTMEGASAAVTSNDARIRAMSRSEIKNLKNRVDRLERFLKANVDAKNEQIRDICEIAEDALNDIRRILPRKTSRLRVAFIDWDGTVVDTAYAGESAFVDLYTRLFSVSTDEALSVWKYLDGKTLQELYRVVRETARERGISFAMDEKECIDTFIAAKVRNIANEGGVTAHVVPSALEFIRYLRSLGIKVHVTSGFRLKELREQISALGLDDALDGVYGSPTDHSEKSGLPANKAEYMKTVLKAYDMSAEEAVMIGDTANDIDSGHEADVMVIGRGKDEESGSSLIAAGAVFAVRDFSNPDRIVRTIDESMASASRGTSELYEVVEGYVNNRRSRFINDANRLADMCDPVSKFDENAGGRKIIHEDPTLAIVDRVQRTARFIDSPGKKKAPLEATTISDYLKANVDQLEADALVASMIIRARAAKKNGQKFFLGLETDWVPGIKETGYGTQHDAINLIMQQIDELAGALRSIGLDNVEIIHKPSEDLADALLDRMTKTQINFSNIVILASDKTVKLPNFKPFMNADNKDRPFIAVINPQYLEEWYHQNRGSLYQLDINIIKLLYTALELADGKDEPNIPLIFKYDKERRIVILLPRAEPKDYQRELLEIYKGRETALKAA